MKGMEGVFWLGPKYGKRADHGMPVSIDHNDTPGVMATFPPWTVMSVQPIKPFRHPVENGGVENPGPSCQSRPRRRGYHVAILPAVVAVP